MYDEKLRILLASEEFENVVMALSLIDSLDDDEYLLIASHIHIDERGNATSSETWKHEAFICVYLLGLLGRKGYPKALEVKKVICKNIIPETIDGLVNLEELVVKGQEIQSIPYEVFHCKKLKNLVIGEYFPRNEKSIFIPDEFHHFHHLESLSIFCNEPYSAIDLSQCKSLSHLSLMGYVPEFTKGIPSLKTLSINSESLTLPHFIFTCLQLEDLEIDNRSITHLEDKFHLLQNLTSIRLQTNALEHFPESITSISTLKKLQVYSNKISAIPFIEKPVQLSISTPTILCRNEMSRFSNSFLILPPKSCRKIVFQNAIQTYLDYPYVEEIEFKSQNFVMSDSNLSSLTKVTTGDLKFVPSSIQTLVARENSPALIDGHISRFTSLKEITFPYIYSPSKIVTDHLNQLPYCEVQGNGTSVRSHRISYQETISEIQSFHPVHLVIDWWIERDMDLSSLMDVRVLDGSTIRFRNEETLYSITLPTSIEILRLNKIGLQIVGSQLPNLKNLKELYIENTQLQDVPDEIYEISSLEKLILHGNYIRKISPKISNLIHLKSLDLSLNRLTSLPELSNLHMLEHLDISANQIQHIPNISTLGKLTHLIAFDIQAKTIDIGALPKTLQWIDISETPIDSIGDFSDFTNLEYLDISKTKISDSFQVQPKTKVVAVGVPKLQISNSMKRIQMDGELLYNQRQNIQHLEELDLRLAFSKQYTHQKNSENLRLNFGHENLQDLCHLKVLWLCGNNLINSPKLPGSLIQLYCRGNDFSTREHSLFDENTSYEHLEEVVLNFTKLSPSTRIPNGQALKRLHLYESTLPNEELLLDVLPTLHKDCSIELPPLYSASKSLLQILPDDIRHQKLIERIHEDFPKETSWELDYWGLEEYIKENELPYKICKLWSYTLDNSREACHCVDLAIIEFEDTEFLLEAEYEVAFYGSRIEGSFTILKINDDQLFVQKITNHVKGILYDTGYVFGSLQKNLVQMKEYLMQDLRRYTKESDEDFAESLSNYNSMLRNIYERSEELAVQWSNYSKTVTLTDLSENVQYQREFDFSQLSEDRKFNDVTFEDCIVSEIHHALSFFNCTFINVQFETTSLEHITFEGCKFDRYTNFPTNFDSNISGLECFDTKMYQDVGGLILFDFINNFRNNMNINKGNLLQLLESYGIQMKGQETIKVAMGMKKAITDAIHMSYHNATECTSILEAMEEAEGINLPKSASTPPEDIIAYLDDFFENTIDHSSMDREKPLKYLLQLPHVNILAYDSVGDLFGNTEGCFLDIALCEINKRFVLFTMDTYIPLYMDGGFDATCEDFLYEVVTKEAGIQKYLDLYARNRNSILSTQIYYLCTNLRFLSPDDLNPFFITPENLLQDFEDSSDLLQENVKHQSASIAQAYRELGMEVQKLLQK